MINVAFPSWSTCNPDSTLQPFGQGPKGVWLKINRRGKPQVLVHVSTYQGKPFWVPVFSNGRTCLPKVDANAKSNLGRARPHLKAFVAMPAASSAIEPLSAALGIWFRAVRVLKPISSPAMWLQPQISSARSYRKNKPPKRKTLYAYVYDIYIYIY